MLARSPDRVAEYLAAIHRLALLIAQHRATFDQERRLPDVVFDALADAGLFRLWLPEALGGPELSPSDFMTVVEAASALDGSVGWLVGKRVNHMRISSSLSRQIRVLDPGAKSGVRCRSHATPFLADGFQHYPIE